MDMAAMAKATNHRRVSRVTDACCLGNAMHALDSRIAVTFMLAPFG
jgi:hypothetical protein